MSYKMNNTKWKEMSYNIYTPKTQHERLKHEYYEDINTVVFYNNNKFDDDDRYKNKYIKLIEVE